MIIERNGYGSNFNQIEICDDVIIKSTKNVYGFNKILDEINFYLFLQVNNVLFKSPKMYSFCKINGIYKIEYIVDCIELYKLFPTLSLEEKNVILDKIYLNLELLHSNTITVSKDQCKKDLYLETINKIYSRIKTVEHVINIYSFIKTVNNITLMKFDDVLLKIEKNIQEYINNIDDNADVVYSLIHGDCQFNNILIKSNRDIIFIDPRGYFGETKLFGLKEYDIAKIYFALTGYDEFDNRIIDSILIDNNNVQIDLFMLDNDILKQDKFITSLIISIWLGNSHIFINNKYKCIYSYFIAMYLATIYL